MHNDETYDIIEQYLTGNMPEHERTTFEERLLADEALKQKVWLRKSTQELIMQNKLKDLKGIMAQEKGRYERTQNLKKAGMALLVTALVTGATWIYLQKDIGPVKQKPDIRKEQPKAEKPRAVEAPRKSIGVSPKGTGQATQEHAVIDARKETPRLLQENTQKSATITETKEPDEVSWPEHSVAEKKTQVPVPAKDRCKGIQLSASIALEEPCAGTKEGVITLGDIQGGQNPYSVSINGGPQGTSLTVKSLREGNYEIELIDANGCKRVFNPVILKAKDCVSQYDFNPNHGEAWQGPIAKASLLSILDKSGRLVYSKQMQEGEQCTWDGYTNTGALAKGYHVFVLENKDGSITKGSITVTE